MKKTVVIGASENPDRVSHTAVLRLLKAKQPVVAVGLKAGKIAGIKILTGHPHIDHVDTITLYVGPRNQPPLYHYMLSLKPKRIIFNPGAENPEFEEMCRKHKIEVVEACTLVMLSLGDY